MATPQQLTNAKKHLRMEADWAEEDGYISALIDASIAQIENDTQRHFNLVDLELRQSNFNPLGIVLPHAPVKEIIEIKYIDVDGVEQVLTDYYFNNQSSKAFIRPLIDQPFPVVKHGYDSVVIRYRAGAEAWPVAIEQAMLLLMGHWYANRESVVIGTITSRVPMAYSALIQAYKVMYL